MERIRRSICPQLHRRHFHFRFHYLLCMACLYLNLRISRVHGSQLAQIPFCSGIPHRGRGCHNACVTADHNGFRCRRSANQYSILLTRCMERIGRSICPQLHRRYFHFRFYYLLRMACLYLNLRISLTHSGQRTQIPFCSGIPHRSRSCHNACVTADHNGFHCRRSANQYGILLARCMERIGRSICPQLHRRHFHFRF